MGKKLFSLFQNRFQCIQVFPEGCFSFFRHFVTGVGFAVNKCFAYRNVFFFFQCFHVSGKIAIRGLKDFFQGTEIKTIVCHQHRHNLKPNPVLENTIKIFERIFHRSYFLYMMDP